MQNSLSAHLRQTNLLYLVFVSACSVLLAGDDTGSVWLYDADSHSIEAKTKGNQLFKQAQVTCLHNEF